MCLYRRWLLADLQFDCCLSLILFIVSREKQAESARRRNLSPAEDAAAVRGHVTAFRFRDWFFVMTSRRWHIPLSLSLLLLCASCCERHVTRLVRKESRVSFAFPPHATSSYSSIIITRIDAVHRTGKWIPSVAVLAGKGAILLLSLEKVNLIVFFHISRHTHNFSLVGTIFSFLFIRFSMSSDFLPDIRIKSSLAMNGSFPSFRIKFLVTVRERLPATSNGPATALS